MKHHYRVEVLADFVSEASSPGQLHTSLMKIVRREGFSEVNFDITISRVRDEVDSKKPAPKKPDEVVIIDPKKKLKGFDKPPGGRGKLSTGGKKPKCKSKRKVKKNAKGKNN